VDPVLSKASSVDLYAQGIIADALSASNTQSFQDDDTLYIIGSYGYNRSTNLMQTFPTLTAINVPGLIQAVESGQAANIVPHIRQSQPEERAEIRAFFDARAEQYAETHTVFKVLKPGRRFICLTPNGRRLWYRWLASACGMETRHLSTDWYLSRHQFNHLLRAAGFQHLAFGYWTFIPRGDMPPMVAAWLGVLDRCGRIAAPDRPRGGLVVWAQR
jgi:hypothetical protein